MGGNGPQKVSQHRRRVPSRRTGRVGKVVRFYRRSFGGVLELSATIELGQQQSGLTWYQFIRISWKPLADADVRRLSLQQSLRIDVTAAILTFDGLFQSRNAAQSITKIHGQWNEPDDAPSSE